MSVRNLLTLMLINWICHTKSKSNFFVYQKSLKRTFNPGFVYKIALWICVLVLWIHKSYCVDKKLVWKVRSKAFWYCTKIFSSKIEKYILFLLTLCTYIYTSTYNYLLKKACYNLPLGRENSSVCMRKREKGPKKWSD